MLFPLGHKKNIPVTAISFAAIGCVHKNINTKRQIYAKHSTLSLQCWGCCSCHFRSQIHIGKVNNPVPVICKDVPYSAYEHHKKHFADDGYNLVIDDGNNHNPYAVLWRIRQ